MIFRSSGVNFGGLIGSRTDVDVFRFTTGGGSVNFQMNVAQFGNNRRGLRSLYNGGFGAILGNSAFDARSFSFSNQPAPKPGYSDAQFAATIGGPLRIPGVLRNGPNLFALYQRTSDHTANTQPALMPTALERAGDFSQTRDALGRAIQIIDPATGLPFAGAPAVAVCVEQTELRIAWCAVLS